MDAKQGSGGWRKFHRFDPYQETDEKQLIKKAIERKQEWQIRLNMALNATNPIVRARAARSVEKTIRAKKIPVTLSKAWGDDGTGN